MSTLQALQHGLDQAWQQVSHGWSQLRRRASRALTRFHSGEAENERQAAGGQGPHGAPEWGLLAAEVHESDEEISVRVEIPGMDAEGFDIQVADELLWIRGEKRIESRRNAGAYRIMECAYGAFERAIPLSGPVDEAHARATYRRGVLRVTLPRRPGRRKRPITVHAP